MIRVNSHNSLVQPRNRSVSGTIATQSHGALNLAAQPDLAEMQVPPEAQQLLDKLASAIRPDFKLL
jgi:hypothetical protein